MVIERWPLDYKVLRLQHNWVHHTVDDDEEHFIEAQRLHYSSGSCHIGGIEERNLTESRC